MLMECNPHIQMYMCAMERLRTTSTSETILLNPQMRLVVEKGADKRRENLPTANEIGVLIPNEYTDPSFCDILLAVREPAGGPRQGLQLQRIPISHLSYMPFHYILLFPNGKNEWGWSLTIQQTDRYSNPARMTQRIFYRYRLHVCNHEPHYLFCRCKLFQQYVCDTWVAVDSEQLQ